VSEPKRHDFQPHVEGKRKAETTRGILSKKFHLFIIEDERLHEEGRSQFVLRAKYKTKKKAYFGRAPPNTDADGRGLRERADLKIERQK